MSSDERQDSLAAQAAAWVPPWERAPRTPDREYQERAEAEARAAAGEPDAPDDAESLDEAGLSDDDDDFDPAFEGANPPAAEPERDQPAGERAGHDVTSAAGGAASGAGSVAAGGAAPSVGRPDAERADAGGAGGPDAERAVAGGRDSGGVRAQASGADETQDSATGDSASGDRAAGDDAGLDEAAAGGDAGVEAAGGDAGVEAAAGGDAAFEGAAADDAVEEPALSEPGDEAAGVDAPVDDVGREPVEVAPGPELPLPESIEEAADAADIDEPGTPVDAPLPAEGDDAGDVFDVAADDDVSDDGELDLPFADEVPASGSDDDDDDDVAADRDDQGDESGSDEDAPTAATSATAVAEGAAAEPAGGGAAVPGQTRRDRGSPATVDEAATRTGAVEVDLPGLSEDSELAGALEAIMLVVDEPVAELQLAQILEQPTERIAAMLDNLSARYTAAGHGFDLRRVAGGWRLYTRPEYAAYVERFVLDGQSVRLTQAALETLAVVAYKQPVTRSRISAIRGVNCDGVMRTLATRGLIEECGTESETGAHLYRTTGLFLEKLGLNSVDQLPPLAPFLPDDVEEVLDATG